MRRSDFETMVRAMEAQLPREFMAGISAVEVTGKTVPHPAREGIYTLGECIPHSFAGPDAEGPTLRSTIQLHYGSFAVLARMQESYPWRDEAWDTLTHELRHHLEWRARVPALEAYDDAVEANYARHDGEPFPAGFHLDGETVAEGVTKVEDDLFLDMEFPTKRWRALAGRPLQFPWHGRPWTLPMPSSPPPTLYLTVLGVTPEPAGDLVVVVRKRPGALDLLRRALVGQASVTATPAAEPPR